MDFLVVQFHSTIKPPKITYYISKIYILYIKNLHIIHQKKPVHYFHNEQV